MKKFIITALVLFFSHNTFAASSDAQAVVADIFAKAAQESIKTDKELQNAISSKVDFSAMAKSVLGAQMKKQSLQEFEWFRSTLQEIITRTVYPNAPGFLAGVKISYKDSEIKGDKTVVKSSVQNKADVTEVNYSLVKSKTGEWNIVDVSFDDESWVESIRDQVSETLKKKKWAGLKKQLNDRLQKLKTENAKKT